MKARLVVYGNGKLLATCPLPQPGTTIGRGEENHVVLNHSRVSRNHAAIHAKDDMWVIKDLGSTNGTEVNGAKVNNAVLKNRDLIRIEPFYLIFETAPDETPWSAERAMPNPTDRRTTDFGDLPDSGPRTVPNKPK